MPYATVARYGCQKQGKSDVFETDGGKMSDFTTKGL